MLVSLRRAWPDAHIDWLVQEEFAPAVASHPDLSGVVAFPRRRFGALWRPAVSGEVVRWLRGLRARRYDLVLDCQGLLRSGLFAWATGAPRRVGYADAAELGWLGCNRRHRVSREMHTVDRMLALVEAEGVAPVRDMRLYTSEKDRTGIDERLAGARYALVAPTARWPGKRWPADRYAAVCRGLLQEGAVERIAVVGGAGERGQCEPVLALASLDERVIDLVGKTDVGGLMALVEASSLALANDSAALHMAVGFARPMVGLFGPTRLDRVGPYWREADVIQRLRPGDRLDHKDEASGRAVMERITVEETLQRALVALSRPVEPPAAALPSSDAAHVR